MSTDPGVPQGSASDEPSPTDAESRATTGASMSRELIALLRHRIATRYYDQAQVIDRVARALVKDARM